MERTYSAAETDVIAEEILATLEPSSQHATILTLQGDLGAGKTTLTQSLARKLGVIETVVSPTFVIAKFYQTSTESFKALIHIDAYRIENISELAPLGWQQMILEPNTLIVLEWPERIKDALPEGIVSYKIEHHDEMRTITRHEI